MTLLRSLTQPEPNLNLNLDGDLIIWNVEGMETVSIHLTIADGTPTLFVVEIKRSNTTSGFVSLSTVKTIAFGAVSGGSAMLEVAVESSLFLALEVTTPEGSALTARIVANGSPKPT